MTRNLSAFEAALVEALNANTEALKGLVAQLTPVKAPSTKASPKVKEPVKVVETSRYARCARPIPCDRVFTPNGGGADKHTCRGFTGTANKRRLS